MGPFQIIIFIVWALSTIALIGLVLMHSGKGTGVSDMIASSLYNASAATGVVALSGLAGATSYLFYYKGISRIGAARAMALNVSYSAWAVVFGFVLQGTIPSAA